MENRCENCIVRQFSVLRAMDKEALKRVSESKVTMVIKKGEVIFEEGKKLNGVYCIRKGVSKLCKLGANGKSHIVKLATKGEILGNRSVVSGETTDLSATALDNMEVCFVPKDEIMTSLDNNPVFTKELLRCMAHQLKEADDIILNLSQKSVKQRIAETFLYLKQHFGEDDKGFLSIVLSREDVSNVVGTATESCIRIISGFKKDGLLETFGKKIKIIDVAQLERVAKGDL